MFEKHFLSFEENYFHYGRKLFSTCGLESGFNGVPGMKSSVPRLCGDGEIIPEREVT
jgi:hypothetical protein